MTTTTNRTTRRPLEDIIAERQVCMLLECANDNGIKGIPAVEGYEVRESRRPRSIRGVVDAVTELGHVWLYWPDASFRINPDEPDDLIRDWIANARHERAVRMFGHRWGAFKATVVGISDKVS